MCYRSKRIRTAHGDRAIDHHSVTSAKLPLPFVGLLLTWLPVGVVEMPATPPRLAVPPPITSTSPLTPLPSPWPSVPVLSLPSPTPLHAELVTELEAELPVIEHDLTVADHRY